jgi:hypothetical protein
VSDLADELMSLGVKSAALVLAAERGLIRELACQMPECRCPGGRSHFESKGDWNPWQPSADRYPVPGRDGGQYTPDNVRLSHVSCNVSEGGKAGQVAHMAKSTTIQRSEWAGLAGKIGGPAAMAARLASGQLQSEEHREACREGARITVRLRIERGDYQSEAHISAVLKGNCQRWNINRGKPCTCRQHEPHEG